MLASNLFSPDSSDFTERKRQPPFLVNFWQLLTHLTSTTAKAQRHEARQEFQSFFFSLRLCGFVSWWFPAEPP